MRCFAITLLADLSLLIDNLLKPEKVKKEVLKKGLHPHNVAFKIRTTYSVTIATEIVLLVTVTITN
jgi:hypothetical protein